MTRMRLGVALAVSLAVPAGVLAQESSDGWGGRAFVSVNAGIQTGSPNFGYEYSTILFDEDARAGLNIPGKRGLAFDIGGGIRLVQNLGVGVTYSRYSKTRPAILSTTIPSPFEYGEASTTERQLQLDREEDAVHFQAIYKIPVTNKFQVGVFGGPSYFRCLDDVVSRFAVQGEVDFQPPQNYGWRVDFRDITQTVDKDSVWGYNAGADVNYLVARHVGVGVTMRYSHTSHHTVNHFGSIADLEYEGVWGRGETTETVTMKHGGLQINGGLSFRF